MLRLCFGFLLLTSLSQAQDRAQLPKWELGLAGFYGYLPDYPGSAQNHSRILPFPYFVYRGDVIRSDQEGFVRTRIFRNLRFELDLSFSGSLPAKSRDNEAREGMPDLNWLFEYGPQLKVQFMDPRNPNQITLKIPLRFLSETNFQYTRYVGNIWNPKITYSRRQFPFPKGIFSITLGSTYASKAVNEYFYDVKPQYATSERAAYSSRAGHMENYLSFLQGLAGENTFWFVSANFSSLSASANTDSPLLKDRSTQTYSVGVAISLYKSSEMGSP